MEVQSPSAKDVLHFQVERSVKSLFKQFIIILEDLQEDHDRAINSLKKTYGGDISKIDYFDQAKADYLRKKILDAGNDCIRTLKSTVDLFDVNISNPK